ncbi:hypothetical protein OK016_26990 [Vibrio chagasii]|nr:hypothetical protein [Vibrio chagasii]
MVTYMGATTPQQIISLGKPSTQKYGLLWPTALLNVDLGLPSGATTLKGFQPLTLMLSTRIHNLRITQLLATLRNPRSLIKTYLMARFHCC